VLPTSGKEFWSNQLKSLAAGNKILLHAYHFLRAVLQALRPQISSKNSGVNQGCQVAVVTAPLLKSSRRKI
jgi:hypothetical protein